MLSLRSLIYIYWIVSYFFCCGFRHWNPILQRISSSARSAVTTPTSTQETASSVTIPTLSGVKFKIKEQINAVNIESIRLRHIEVATQELAEECRTLVSSGQMNFADLAMSVSISQHSKSNGGDLGWYYFSDNNNQSIIPKELINAALSMNKNDLLALPVTETSSWHLLQLLDVSMKVIPTIMKHRKNSFHQILQTTNLSTLTYTIETMGCQMNIADSERMEAQLQSLGMVIATSPELANVVILNTCSIRDHAEQKVYSYLGPYALRKKKRLEFSNSPPPFLPSSSSANSTTNTVTINSKRPSPSTTTTTATATTTSSSSSSSSAAPLAIIIAGCVAQQEGDHLLRRFPEIDIIMGPQYVNRMANILESVFLTGQQMVLTEPMILAEDTFTTLTTRTSEITAYVNVIYGCNEHCTYCVVPQTRGVEQSRSKEAIIQEIQELIQHGYQEVTLLGQNIDAWGRDMIPKQRFADLLENIVRQVPKLKRLRFLTSHPKYLSTRVLQVMQRYQHVLMPCINIPFQSGSNRILKAMRRGYRVERYLEIIRKIRSILPDTAITADCIVGFPGETEEEFQATLVLMEEVSFQYEYIYVIYILYISLYCISYQYHILLLY
jgi:tRNA-2-methylthio-N6-dimethylallyladenosine synthase